MASARAARNDLALIAVAERRAAKSSAGARWAEVDRRQHDQPDQEAHHDAHHGLFSFLSDTAVHRSHTVVARHFTPVLGRMSTASAVDPGLRDHDRTSERQMVP